MNLQEIIEKISQYSNPVKYNPNYLFRGQADVQWGLEPALTRIAKNKSISRKKTIQMEHEAVSNFSISATNVLPIERTIMLTLSSFQRESFSIDKLGWFPIMQHFSAPTRLLDWSFSQWVALYFACCEKPECDGVLWIVDFNRANDYSRQRLTKRGGDADSLCFTTESEEIVIFLQDRVSNERVEIQQGRFSVCTNPLSSHEVFFRNCESLEKIVISSELKFEIQQLLHTMNINAKTLFPGIDGLGKSVFEFYKLWDETSHLFGSS